ncbi:uncharacterized protein LOC122386185 [Amphibalanus amphitrite]|uniref:uncharacterized protein LOC122386185 n=1 Tax=Amphibalanus amphitrite TaxID=1232801 RepID=UPI001C927241|nr:uncharacterized protein LOC122386185 [Amphibalanus amphitrite]
MAGTLPTRLVARAALLAILASAGRAVTPGAAVEGSGTGPAAPGVVMEGSGTGPATLLAADAGPTAAQTSERAACPAVRFASLLQCAARDRCRSDSHCPAGLLCCPGACGRRCRCPRAVCSPGCGAGERCIWRRRCTGRRLCRPRAVCVPEPATPVCLPPCGAGLGCRRRPWPLSGGVCAPLDLREILEDAVQHDERDDCYENDDDEDDLFDDDLFEASVRYRPQRPQQAAAPTVSNNRVFAVFGRKPVASWPGVIFRYDDDDDDDDDYDDDDDHDGLDYDDLFDFDK